ncbi:putative S-layer protein (plasmid) [Bacillus thuringiensis HD-771]|uniref:S-layer protein n=1 Tax=Bacillus thuringiensis HD-771 TaxID=1218175 RepID=A0A9W3JGK7_BACTU|nr:S-layer homology domain-containing protein [Bacillus thuringiensis]AFQ19743.1 putative S-layer protein [Bacillus thuringiensis HD-771]MEC3515732.1 S-layer homology domain-containing protein [Bacillus thuringiensis]
MGKIMKIFCVIPILIGMIFFSEKSSFAAENELNTITKEEAQRKAAIYVQTIGKQSYPNWINSSFSESKTLRDLDGKVKGYLFQIEKDSQDYGYVIVNGSMTGTSIIESTRVGNNPYKDIHEDHAVYTGPIQYFKKKNGLVTSLSTNEIIPKKDLIKNKVFKEELVYSSKNFGVNTMQQEIYNSKIIKDVPDYTWFVGCVPTAIANIVVYWSKNGFPNLLKSNETSDWLIDTLGTMMGTDRGTGESTGGVKYGTYTDRIAPALQIYWNNRGYSSLDFEYSEYEKIKFDTIKRELDSGRPYGISITKHNLYKDHYLTGIGYEELIIPDLNEIYQTLIVHDTWDTTPEDVYLDYNELINAIDSYLLINPYIFKDVPKGYWAYDQIMYMVGNKIMTGYGNGYFGAQDNMTREQLAAFLYRYLKPIDTNENPYVDIHDSPFKKEITALTKRGIFSVNSEKKFNPKNTATRAEIAAVLTKAFDLKVKANYEFNDMKGHWANESVKALYSNGIANGIGNKNFGPSANVTREQMAMFLYKAINLDPNYIPTPI